MGQILIVDKLSLWLIRKIKMEKTIFVEESDPVTAARDNLTTEY